MKSERGRVDLTLFVILSLHAPEADVGYIPDPFKIGNDNTAGIQVDIPVRQYYCVKKLRKWIS